MAPSQSRVLSRRAALTVGVTASAAAFVGSASPASASSTRWPAHLAQPIGPRSRELEERYQARLGVHAVNIRTGATVAHRASTRFAFCSTLEVLAAAAVLRDGAEYAPLDRLIAYPERDLLPHAPITEDNVDTGMTVGELAAAALRYSDGTAGNLLLRQIGGPARQERLRQEGLPDSRRPASTCAAFSDSALRPSSSDSSSALRTRRGCAASFTGTPFAGASYPVLPVTR